MTADYDPLIRIQELAVAMRTCEKTIVDAYMEETMPRPDGFTYVASRRGRGARAWRLSTLRRWNPAIANRCQALLHALENLPLSAA